MTQPPNQPPPVEPPPLPPAPERIEDNAGLRLLLPLGLSGKAIAAGYLGLVSVLAIPAPAALILGIFALRDIARSRKKPPRKYGMGRAIFGIVMGGAFTVLYLAVLISMAVREIRY